MELWGANLYGKPCHECDWTWPADPRASVDYVAQAPERYRLLLAGRDGRERHPDLAWSVTGYVCHVADNLRQWAERVAGTMETGDGRVGGYDPDALAAARRYCEVSLAGAVWSLQHGCASWVDVLTAAVDANIVLSHATRGEQRAEDVASNNAHDVHHHAWDIGRILAHPT